MLRGQEAGRPRRARARLGGRGSSWPLCWSRSKATWKTQLSNLSSVATAGERDVDAYIAAAPKAVQPMLKQLREAIKRAAPQAEEKVSYRMAAYFHHGRLIYFAAHKNHVGLYPIIGREKDL